MLSIYPYSCTYTYTHTPGEHDNVMLIYLESFIISIINV